MANKTEALTFSEPAMRKIAAAVRRLLAEPRNDPRKDRQFPGYNSRGHMFGETATCDEFPTYPLEMDLPDTYVVKLQEWHFTEQPGNRPISKIDWSQYVVARVWNSRVIGSIPSTATEYTVPAYLPEGTAVKVWPVWTRRGVRWWIDVASDEETASSSSSSSESSDSSESSESSESSGSSESSPSSDEPSSEPSSEASSDESSEASSDGSSDESSDGSSDESSGASSEASSDDSSVVSSEPSSEPSSGDYTCDGECTMVWTGSEWTGVGGTYTCEPSDQVGICVCDPPAGAGEYPDQVEYGTCAKG